VPRPARGECEERALEESLRVDYGVVGGHAVERDLQLGPVRERGLVEGHDDGAVDDTVLDHHGVAVGDEGPGAGADLEGQRRGVERVEPGRHQGAMAVDETRQVLGEEGHDLVVESNLSSAIAMPPRQCTILD
jgi:hypothetical protein